MNIELEQPQLSTPAPTGWANWTSAEKGGVVAAVLLVALLLVVLAGWAVRRRRRLEEERMRGHQRRRGGRRGSPDGRGHGRGKRVRGGSRRSEEGGQRSDRRGENGGARDLEIGRTEIARASTRNRGGEEGRRDSRHRGGDESRRKERRGQRKGSRYEMSGGLAEPEHQEEDRIPVGQRPLLPPNQQRRVRTEASTGGTIKSGERRTDRERRLGGIRDV